MYNEKIEELIDLALLDGELTEKEKQVLFKRAEAEGINLDEFEMVLDARLFKLKKAQKGTPSSEHIEELINLALEDGELTETEKQFLFKKAEAAGIDLDEFEMVLNARLFKLKKTQKDTATSKNLDNSECNLHNTENENSTKETSEKKLENLEESSESKCGLQNTEPENYAKGITNAIEKKYRELKQEQQDYIAKQDNDDEDDDEEHDFYNLGYDFENYEDDDLHLIATKKTLETYPLPISKEDCIESLYFIQNKIHDIDDDYEYASYADKTKKMWRNLFDAILNKLKLENPKDSVVQGIVAQYSKKESKFRRFLNDLGF